jgi:PilZ domain
VRSAVLEVEGRNHIVAVTDLGPQGAFLRTRVAVDAKQRLRLRIILPRDGREIALPCELVRRAEQFDAATGYPAGVAVRFHGLDAAAIRRVEEFAMEGFLPSPEPTPEEHYEYRVLERPEVDADELNRLGRDGWNLASTMQTSGGVRLVLSRRL